MQHVVDALHRTACYVELGEITFNELDSRHMSDVLPLAGGEVIDDADALTATDELFHEVRTDKAGAAGYEVIRHLRSS